MTGSWRTKLEKLGGEKRIHYSLDRFQEALKDAGNPQAGLKSIVIAGTNGKGTTTLLVSRALQLQGYRVATYLSPHLQLLTERFLEQLVPWSLERFDKLCEAAWPFAEKHQLSYFEFLTLVFFLDCAQNSPDFAVIEVGLGGRLDATNVTNPLGTVITNIDWDHMDYLGNSLEKILSEKMGILRERVSVTTGIEQPELLKQLQEFCEPRKIAVHKSTQVAQHVKEKSWNGQWVELDGQEVFLRNPSSGALKNAALVYLFLKENFPEIDTTVLKKTFSSLNHPGRFEIVSEHPKVILSGDHNLAGMKTLTNVLKELKAQELYCICGFSPDKNASEMLKMIQPFCKEVTLTKCSRARGEYAGDYETLARFEADPQKAVQVMLQKMNPDDVLLVTGSLYLVGEVRANWKKEIVFY